MSVEVEPFEPFQPGLSLSEPSYCSEQFVSDMQHLDTSLVYLQKVNTSREETGNFSFSSKTEFPLVHQSGPYSGVIYIGEGEEPSHLLDTRTMESNTHQVTTPADSPAPSDPNTHQVTTPADSPAPSDPNTHQVTALADSSAASDPNTHQVTALADSSAASDPREELASDRGSLASDKGLSDGTHVRDAHDAPGESALQDVGTHRTTVDKEDLWCRRNPSLLPVRLHLTIQEGDVRKFSDPATHIRREWIKRKGLHRQRCLSDSEAPKFSVEEDEPRSEEGDSSALGYDSGFHDDIRSKFYGSSSPWGTNSPAMSDSESPHDTLLLTRSRKTTPHFSGVHEERDSPSEEYHPPLSRTYRARRQLTKHLSASSVGGTSLSSMGASSESPSVSSLLDCQSQVTVTDVLSSLGFDDFDSPQLVPDRFIPREVEYAKPSLMRVNTLTEQQDTSLQQLPPPSPDSVAASVPATHELITDLPLGATAENFLSRHAPMSPPPTQTVSSPISAIPTSSHPDPFLPGSVAIYTNPSISQFNRGNAVLETVLEETASDLSASPRALSPRVSIDHSIDIMEGKLGASLAVQKSRKRSLPTQREGCKLSIGSQVESEPDSIYFSVTSYDDDIAAEREREKEELSTPLAVDDSFQMRRRRRGVYTPPPGLLSWLSSQQSISEEETPDELPWPFSEQAHLRTSLSEIHRAQQNEATDGSETSEGEVPLDNSERPSPPDSSPHLDDATLLHTSVTSNSSSVCLVPPDTLSPGMALALGYENDCQCLRQELDSPQVNTATETLHTQNLAVTSTQTKQQQRQQLLQKDPT